jgi:hypothetical protein
MLDPNLAETEKASIRDLPAALLKITFELLIPTDRAPPATFWVPYNDDERNIGLRACLLVWTVTYSKLVSREFQLPVDSEWRLQLLSCLGGLVE